VRELRLRTSLVLLLILAISITFSLVGSAILLYRLPQLEARIQVELQERAESTSRLLDHHMDGIEAQMRTLARLVATRSDSDLQPFLDAMVDEGRFIEAAFVLDAKGNVLTLGLPDKSRQAAAELRGIDFSRNPIFQSARALSTSQTATKTVWSDKYLSALSGKHAVGVAMPVADKVVIIQASMERILLMLSNATGDASMEVNVIDSQGHWLASSRPDTSGSLNNYAMRPSFQAVLGGRPLPPYEEFQGKKLVVGGSLSQKLGWVIAAAAPAGLGNASYRVTVILVIGGFLGSVLLAMTLAPMWAGVLTRPVNALIDRAHRVRDGDYTSPWPRRGSILELNQLSNDFGQMVDVIQVREAAMLRSEERLRATLDSTPTIAVQWFDLSGRVLYWNQASQSMYGFTKQEAEGVSIVENPLMYQDTRQVQAFLDLIREIDLTGKPVGPAEFVLRHKDGSNVTVLATTFAIPGDAGHSNFVCMDVDITERILAEGKIHELAFYDQLTSLPNRTLLLDRLRQAMAASSRSQCYCALLFIDLDNFKTLNDTLGHDIGDDLLKQVAQRLLHSVREGDTVARLGGDEFVVVLAGLSTDKDLAASAIETASKKILAVFDRSYQLGEISQRSTASVGVTLFQGDKVNTDDLMKQADLAMYRSKDSGRNTWHFFDPAMESNLKERAALEDDLRHGLDDHQLLLHYQAQVDANDKVTGAEVLMRWLHPRRGMVSPGDFIPLAETTGLILPMGQWVLKTACMQLASWATRPERADLTIAVNVSAHQFRHADFVNQVLDVLRQTGANPQRLKLELTESLLVSNVEQVIAKMSALRACGVRFSLDDFGTGYSSLSYLKRLPLDQLKIDQSFVRDVLTDHNDASIARTVVALAHNLGLGVIAEGVETSGQRDFLAQAGCLNYQGYFFSRPLPIDGFEAFLG
jgi:diguanylate cyclase (GGDEF)-like protein/PAS domain S-box-containing protein